MEIQKLPFEQVNAFSQKDIAYATANPALRSFYKYDVSLETFAQVIEDKKQDNINRSVLVEVLKEQYARIDTTQAVLDNIDALGTPETFTVITAHQPSLCTGPLYYVLKIASTINLTRQLNQKYPGHTFVPVFVVGGEDHDFEEINHFRLFNKEFTWENDEMGAVGMMQTKNIQKLLPELKEVFGNSEHASRVYEVLERAYTQNELYGRAAIQLTNDLFQQYGLVVCGMNHPKFKRLFIPAIEEEVFNQPSKDYVEKASAALEEAGFSGQAFPREINFFYLRPNSRERIVEEDGIFKVHGTDLSFTPEALKQEIQDHPERFSPNVVMRPIYQETILPNLAYIGGGGEISYWLERKEQFAHFDLNFPMLIRRNSALWIDKGSKKKIDKLQLTLADLCMETEALIKVFIKKNTENEINLAQEKGLLKDIFEQVKGKVAAVDQSLVKTVMAEHAKQEKSLEQLQGKIMRAEKQRFEVSLNQIRSLKEKLFPNNGLQERRDNFLNFYLKHGDHFFDLLITHLDPMDKAQMIVFLE